MFADCSTPASVHQEGTCLDGLLPPAGAGTPHVVVPRSAAVERALAVTRALWADNPGTCSHSLTSPELPQALTCARQPDLQLVPPVKSPRAIPRRVTSSRNFWLQRRLPL